MIALPGSTLAATGEADFEAEVVETFNRFRWDFDFQEDLKWLF